MKATAEAIRRHPNVWNWPIDDLTGRQLSVTYCGQTTGDELMENGKAKYASLR
jgi:hypothetical protein